MNRFEYDRVNRRTKRVLPNGVTTEWQYDWQDRVTNLTHKTSGGTTLASAGYVRATGGEPTRITREDGTYVDLKYDAALRLTNEVYYNSGGTPQSTNGYGYDKAGNRVRFVSGATTLTNAVQKGYRITEVKNGGSTVETYGYDNGGRVTSIARGGTTLTLAYNSADQLVAVTNGAAWTNYVYDASGRRVRAEDSGGQRRFLVAPTPDSDLESIHLVADSGNNLKQGYVYVGDEPLLRFNAAGNPVYYLEDAMGSVIGLLSNGTAIATFKYDGFGQMKGLTGVGTNAPPGTEGDFRFHRAWLETTTDLYHMRAREYDQRMGRFLSRDPREGDVRLPESKNPYAFANNNSHVFLDPSGEENIASLSAASFAQTMLSTLKHVALHEGKQQVISSLGSAVGNFIVKELLSQYVPSGAWDKFLEKGAFAGNKLTDSGQKAFCSVLQDSEWAQQIHFEVSIRNSGKGIGDPSDNGFGCKPDGSVAAPKFQILASHSRPDFIIGRAPYVEPGVYNDSYVIGDFKLTTQTLYEDYVGSKRKVEQFNAIRAFAKEHTVSKVAIFLVVAKDPKKTAISNKVQIQYMKRILMPDWRERVCWAQS